MAKAKKTTALTVEERLEQALMPEAEQPYQVPGNWCWARLGSLYEINPRNNAVDSCAASFIPMEKIAPGMSTDFTYEIQPWEMAKKGHTHFADGDVAFAKISPCFENRKSMILIGLENGIGAGTTELIVLRQSKINMVYTYWLISEQRFISGGMSTYSGTVGQQRISMDFVKNYSIPLPPLDEQQRIVDRIESLFAKLDEAKEKAQAALDSFETRRAAILHKAFTGELTAKWREENGITLETWHMTQFGDLILDGLQNGLYKPKTAYGTGIKIIRIDSFYDGNIEPWDTLKSLELSDAERELYGLRQGDLLINRVNSMAYLGKSALVRTLPNECVFESNIMRLSLILQRVCPEFAVRFLNSAAGLSELRKNAKQAVNQASINQQDVKSVEFLLPSIKEQAEIICLLEDFFTKEQKAKELCSVIDNIDLIKKSILARAFRGELGTNDPTEESAVELLKTIC